VLTIVQTRTPRHRRECAVSCIVECNNERVQCYEYILHGVSCARHTLPVPTARTLAPVTAVCLSVRPSVGLQLPASHSACQHMAMRRTVASRLTKWSQRGATGREHTQRTTSGERTQQSARPVGRRVIGSALLCALSQLSVRPPTNQPT